MIEVLIALLALLAGTLLGYFLGLYFAAQNQTKVVAETVKRILSEQGYEIRDGQIVPKEQM